MMDKLKKNMVFYILLLIDFYIVPYTKEINLISWNGREPKYDIRSFSPNREKCGKGITLNADEAAALLKALQKEVNSGD